MVDKLESISIYKDGFRFVNRHVKETMIIAGNIGNTQFPLAYIKKPKSISVEDWGIIKDKLQINLLK